MSRYVHGGISDQRHASLRRLADARILREHEHWRGAMYMLGYAVECRIKARLMEENNVWTLEDLESTLRKRHGCDVNLRIHDLDALSQYLMAHSRLRSASGPRRAVQALGRCNQWSVHWRYSPDQGSKNECFKFFEAAEEFMDYLSGIS